MKFTTGQIITAATGTLCCDMGKCYEILNFLTGDNLFTHQLPRAMRASKRWVEEQHVWLTRLEMDQCTPETVHTWLSAAEAEFGTEHDLKPLPPGVWKPCDPVRELIELTEDKSKVIVI